MHSTGGSPQPSLHSPPRRGQGGVRPRRGQPAERAGGDQCSNATTAGRRDTIPRIEPAMAQDVGFFARRPMLPARPGRPRDPRRRRLAVLALKQSAHSFAFFPPLEGQACENLTRPGSGRRYFWKRRISGKMEDGLQTIPIFPERETGYFLQARPRLPFLSPRAGRLGIFSQRPQLSP